MVIFGGLLVGGIVALLVLFILAGKRYESLTRSYDNRFKLTALAPPMLYISEKWRLMERFPKISLHVHTKLVSLYGSKDGLNCTRLYIADLLAFCYLSLLLAPLMPLITDGEASGAVVGLLLAVLVPAVMVKDLEKKVVRRRQDLVLELPELLNKMTLLVGAGETVQQALIQCVEQAKSRESHPLYAELRKLANELANGFSFSQSLERLNARCGVQEVSVFTTTLLLNYRRGGEQLVLSLRELSRMLWEKRKAICRMRGEEASSKLVFPMAVIFMIVLALVGAPAFLSMNF